MPTQESPLLVKCLSRSWSTAHPASQRTPQVDDVVDYLGKRKVTPQVSSRLITTLISRGVNDSLIDALPALINSNRDRDPSDHDSVAVPHASAWPLAVVASSIARSTLADRLSPFHDPFDHLIDKLKHLVLPSSIEHSAPSITTPLELLSTSTRVVVTQSTSTPEISFLPLQQLSNYLYQSEAALLTDSLVDLDLQEPHRSTRPAKQPPQAPPSIITPIPNPVSLSRPSPRTPKMPQFPLTKLGRSSAPELSRRRAYSSKVTTGNPNNFVSPLSPAGPSTAPVSRLSNLSLQNRTRVNSGNASLPSSTAQGSSPTDVVILDPDDGDPDPEIVEVNAMSDPGNASSHSSSLTTPLRRRSVGVTPARNNKFDENKFRQKLIAREKKQRDASYDADATGFSLPPPSDTFYAREQNRKMKLQERNNKKRAFREREEERRKDKDKKRREQKLKNLRRNSRNSNSDDDDDSANTQHDSRSKRVRLPSAQNVNQTGAATGPGSSLELIEIDGDNKEEPQTVPSADEYETRRRKLMDMVKGHTDNLSPRDLTKIEAFLKGEDIFGRHASVDILLHHDCAKSGNHHYLRLIKDPRTVEQIFRSNVF